MSELARFINKGEDYKYYKVCLLHKEYETLPANLVFLLEYI